MLKSSDIVSAKAAVAEKKVVNRDTDASEKSVAEDMTSEILVEGDGNLYTIYASTLPKFMSRIPVW